METLLRFFSLVTPFSVSVISGIPSCLALNGGVIWPCESIIRNEWLKLSFWPALQPQHAAEGSWRSPLHTLGCQVHCIAQVDPVQQEIYIGQGHNRKHQSAWLSSIPPHPFFFSFFFFKSWLRGSVTSKAAQTLHWIKHLYVLEEVTELG